MIRLRDRTIFDWWLLGIAVVLLAAVAWQAVLAWAGRNWIWLAVMLASAVVCVWMARMVWQVRGARAWYGVIPVRVVAPAGVLRVVEPPVCGLCGYGAGGGFWTPIPGHPDAVMHTMGCGPDLPGWPQVTQPTHERLPDGTYRRL